MWNPPYSRKVVLVGTCSSTSSDMAGAVTFHLLWYGWHCVTFQLLWYGSQCHFPLTLIWLAPCCLAASVSSCLPGHHTTRKWPPLHVQKAVESCHQKTSVKSEDKLRVLKCADIQSVVIWWASFGAKCITWNFLCLVFTSLLAKTQVSFHTLHWKTASPMSKVQQDSPEQGSEWEATKCYLYRLPVLFCFVCLLIYSPSSQPQT